MKTLAKPIIAHVRKMVRQHCLKLAEDLENLERAPETYGPKIVMDYLTAMTDRLSYNLPQPYVVARDRTSGYVLLGGLGVLQVGQMWVPDGTETHQLQGYQDAPERQFICDYGTPA